MSPSQVGTYEVLEQKGTAKDKPFSEQQTAEPPTFGNTDVDIKEFEHGYFVNQDGKTCFGAEKNGVGETTQIAEGWAVIRIILELETPTGIEKTFIVACKPANEDLTTFTISAKDASNGKLLKAELVNAFGRHSIGMLKLEVIQALSKYTRTIRLVDRPQWLHDKLVAPGLDKNITYDFEQFIKIDFTADGDADRGVEALEMLLRIFDPGNALIVMAAMIGAPVIAKLWPGERFETFLQAGTGTHKTTFVQLLMCMFGMEYAKDINIVTWAHGATPNALEHLAARTGPFPFVIDNYKNYTEKDPSKFQATTHTICEGGEKKRMLKIDGMRRSDDYQCMPIVTGENYPGQDAASRARTVMLRWTGAVDIKLLTEAQTRNKDLNKLGQEFCLWLSSGEGQNQLRQLSEKFDPARARYFKEIGTAVNAGRIATNAALIALIWELLYNFPPMCDLAEEFKEAVEEAIATHITHSKAEVSEDQDSERFRAWLQSQIEIGTLNVGAAPIGPSDDPRAPVIGHYRDGDLLITPAVFRSVLVPAWQKSTNGAKADVRSLLSQLAAGGCLQYDKTHQVYTKVRRIDNANKRVHVFNWERLMEDASSHR